MKRFEVGKEYRFAESGADPIKVVRRTAKMIFVIRDGMTDPYHMKIHEDDDVDSEYVTDSYLPKRYWGAYTSYAMWEV